MPRKKRVVAFKDFWADWTVVGNDWVFNKAAQFATKLGQSRLITITVKKMDKVTVWYWKDA